MALLRALNPELNAAQLKAILVETAAPGVTNEATPGQPSPLDQSVPIPEGRGAGVLRVDQAALRVVKDLRQSKGEPSPPSTNSSISVAWASEPPARAATTS